MKIKFDFWMTPDGYTGDGHPSIGRAYRVKGGVELPDAPLIALLAAVGSEYIGNEITRPKLIRAASALLDAAMEETQNG